LLSYLISCKYDIPVSFQYEAGVWDGMHMAFIEESDVYTSPITMKLKTGRLDALALKFSDAFFGNMDKKNEAASKKTDLLQDDNDDDIGDFVNKVSLMDVMMCGVTCFYNSEKYTELIEVNIDMEQDRYKRVIISPTSKMCTVYLVPGTGATDNEIEEDLAHGAPDSNIIVIRADDPTGGAESYD